ncbi:UNVERIFIED_CONTAM: DExH-box ATP-dependent RNA helicase DExH5, mitochondrial [Sesamum radiatum]|uniref:RNA helicase n=1 Tax=Sesamum radiatum TaxID=300843 RepID=A0AAW2V4W2_SESRA
MYLLSLKFSPYTSYSKTLKPHTATPPPPPPLRRLLVRMKDRPPSPYGALYVPPHHRLRSVITAASTTTDSKPTNVATYRDADERRSFASPKFNNDASSNNVSSYPYLPPHLYRKQLQQQREISRHDDVAEQDSGFEFSAQPGAASSENIIAWKRKLNALLRSADKQELVSREKKDRRDFEQIAALAGKMGLYSHLYMKVVVVSKVPLPNYRFDLDDKRPQREVILPPGLQKRVDAYFVDYISGKCKSLDTFSTSSSDANFAAEESLFEEPEPIPHSKAAMEKIFWRRSLQMRNEQYTWQDATLQCFPWSPNLGKCLLFGVIFNCLDPILSVVAGLSVRDPFLAPMDKKDLAEAAKAQFSHDYSDHLALVRAYEGWKVADRDNAGYEYCWKNFLSAQSMKAIDSLRKEFYSLLKDTGLVDSNPTIYNVWSYDEHLLRAIICYGLYPGICSVVHNERSFSLKTMEDGQVLLYSNSVNARHSRIPYPWLVFNEKKKVNSVFLRDSTAVSDSMLLLFGGSITKGDMDGHLKMLGGYLEFYMDPALAELSQSLRRELDELIQIKLLNPAMDISTYHELLSAVRLLIAEDQCGGRFVFNRQVLQPCSQSIGATAAQKPALTFNTESGPGGDNPKSQLQTLLTRAGHAAPSYKTKQLKNNQFQATVEFNGMQLMGQPCNNKKQAEKDAAAEALQWLLGGNVVGRDYIDHLSMLLKKSKKDHK